MIQALLDATPVGGVCTLPAGHVDVLERTSFTVPRSMTIRGDGTVIDIVDGVGARSTAVPTAHLFNADGLVDGSELHVRDLTVNGPDCSGWATSTSTNTGVIGWERAKTFASTLTVDNLTVTGGYSTAVRRSGGGRMSVTNSTLEAWVNPVVFFESSDTGWGDLLLRDCLLVAPSRTKSTSVGVYIHPHLHLTAERVHGCGWNRWVIYLNGSPQSSGHHDLIDVTATDCALIQTGSSSVTTLVRCVEEGNATKTIGGSYFKGPVRSIDCTWASTGMIGFMGGFAADRVFIGDTFRGPGIWIAGSGSTSGTIRLVRCTVEHSGRNTGLRLNAGSTIVADIQSCVFTGTTAKYSIELEGGTARLVDTPMPARTRVVAPGVLS